MAAYIVHLPRREAWRFRMFSTIVLRSEAIACVTSIEPDRVVRLVQTDARIAGVLAQMFPKWRIERLAETAVPRSGGPVLMYPPILVFEEDPVVASGTAGHVDRSADRPIQR